MQNNLPLQLFEQWYDEEQKISSVKYPSACCLSTIGLDGSPNARFVSLKQVTDQSLIVTGTLTSRKGLEIANNNKVALTFWWTETERQVRVQGTATRIGEQLAEKYFAERDRESQIVSMVSEQGKDIAENRNLFDKYEAGLKQNFIKKPDNWGGYAITPVRIELMQFKISRLHNRTLYEHKNSKWIQTQLQP